MKYSSYLKNVFSLLSVLLVASLLSGCILAPIIDSFKSVGATEQDRRELFDKQLKLFQDSRQWGRHSVVAGMIYPESADKLDREMRKLAKDQKLVEYRVEELKFLENSYVADVEVVLKGYRVPFYVVDEERERQQWRFILGTGWQLVARENLK